MKKFLLFVVSLVICLLSTTMICYANEYDDYVNEVNSKYNLEIEKNNEVEQKCSFEEFKNHVDEIVESQLCFRQKEILYAVEQKNTFEKFLNINNGIALNSYSTVTKSKISTDSSFKIKATYDYNNGTPKYVKKFRNISWIYRYPTVIMDYSPYSGYPKVSLIDSGRTGVVKYNGVFSDPYNSVNNYSFSAEFYAP